MPTPTPPDPAADAGGAAPSSKYLCARCEDWGTVVIANATPPCPSCRPEQYAAWLADAGSGQS